MSASIIDDSGIQMDLGFRANDQKRDALIIKTPFKSSFRLLFFLALILGLLSEIVYAAPATPTNPSPGSTTSPGPTMSGTSVTLSWSASSGATSYGVGVRDMVTNTYRWNVNAVNSTGGSAYTTPRYFTMAAAATIPATPTNPSPGSTSSPGPTMSGTSVTLSWSASSGATSYGVGVRDMVTNTHPGAGYIDNLDKPNG